MSKHFDDGYVRNVQDWERCYVWFRRNLIDGGVARGRLMRRYVGFGYEYRGLTDDERGLTAKPQVALGSVEASDSGIGIDWPRVDVVR